MSAHRIEEVRRFMAQRADEILGEFKPGAKITILVRGAAPDGSQDMMITNDELDDIERAIVHARNLPAGIL